MDRKNNNDFSRNEREEVEVVGDSKVSAGGRRVLQEEGGNEAFLTTTGGTASSSSASSSARWSQLFRDAVARYADQNRPDPIARKQMDRWEFEWIGSSCGSGSSDRGEDQQRERQDPMPPVGRVSAVAATSHELSGKLLWKGEHMQVLLSSSCRWSCDGEGDDRGDCRAMNSKDVGGWLRFTCSASAEPLLAPYTSDGDGGRSDRHSAAASQSMTKKVHERMVQRLIQDDYIQKLLLPAGGVDGDSNKNQEKEGADDGALLCEADIRVQPSTGLLEERAFTDEGVAEAIRRAVWGSADDALDVLDLVVQLPLLPCTTTASSSSKSKTETRTTPLADRAQLRLLEDAMHDACEREGDEEIVDELEITSSRQKQNQHSAAVRADNNLQGKNSRQRNNRGNKRRKS